MEVGCCLWWVEDILQWRHPTVMVVDTNCDTSVLGDSCSDKECLLSLVKVQLELPVLLQSNTDVTHKTSTTVSDNDSNTYITYKRTTILSDNDSNTDVTHKTTTTVSDNDNTETSHTRKQPLCLTMTTQRRHTQDNNHCV